MKNVTIIDYDMCNMLNVARAFEHCGASVHIADKPDSVASADRLVLPGVGAFPDCMRELRSRGFEDPIREFARTGRPMLGICVGMQALFDESEEFGRTNGLGMMPGKVVAIPAQDVQGNPQRVPHIGWTHLSLPPSRQTWEGTILANLGPAPAFYFVHSFAARPLEPSDRLADAIYGGHRVSAAVQRENIVGVQFHPEKSGEAGLGVIRNFLAA
jgi:glutamine amidotransferase